MAGGKVISPADRRAAAALVGRAAARRWPGAQLDGITALAGDASSRRYLRCTIEAGVGGVPPPTCVVMLMDDPSIALSSEELGVFGKTGPQELPFLNLWRFLSPLTESVPEVYETSPDCSALLLEDVGDVTLWAAAERVGVAVEELFVRALELLADLQEKAVPGAGGADACYAFRQSFNTRLFTWEFDHFLEYGLESPPQSDLEACRLELTALARQLGNTPKVFCHRDYHAWNIHLQEERLRLIDFQDALLGPPLYDVASLLTDRITPQVIDRSLERRLVARFAGLRPATGGEDDAYEMFQRCALQRSLKVIGRFNFLAEEKRKPHYLSLLPAVVATARRFCSEVPGLETTAFLLSTRVKGGYAAKGDSSP